MSFSTQVSGAGEDGPGQTDFTREAQDDANLLIGKGCLRPHLFGSSQLKSNRGRRNSGDFGRTFLVSLARPAERLLARVKKEYI